MFNKIVVILCFFTLCSCDGIDNGKVFDYLDLSEGSTCAWDGQQGRCTNINNCTSAKDALQQNMHPPICSFQGLTAVVCCLTGASAQFPKKMLRTPDPVIGFADDPRPNELNKARDNCFRYLKTLPYSCRLVLNNFEDGSSSIDRTPLEATEQQSSRRKRETGQQNSSKGHAVQKPQISNGKAAYRRQYPHMALLGYGEDIDSAQWLCGGSVISEKYILTAAHCISSPSVGPVKFAAMGILKRSDHPEYWQTYNVTRIIAHPEYHPPSKYNDIALLETEKTISFNADVLPACLPLVPEADEFAEATGWGALGHRKGLADVLQTVQLKRYDTEKCSQLYPKHRHLREGYDPSSQMCYGNTVEAKDTCEGDSGGPLQTANVFQPCAYTVLGVTSYGRQCGISAGSGMYTRVFHYVPWIESIVWP